ncbi:MAG TPA: cytochrome d ubiquinol oxidase subunit II [Verrucomicrobiae bacterium]|nr:cytochrome d ubiquinol oxidase subunit II [Verrucomicrobiae bacterium]
METIWFCLLMFMLGTYVVLGGTDLGVGILHLCVARNETKRQQVIRSIRPVWKPNEVWLIAAGGTLFLAFPTALAVSFSGFYLALMLVLWLLVLRGLGLELRYQLPDVLWRQFWDVAVSASSLLLALCLGAALGNVVRGVPLDEHGVFFEPLWTNFRVGDQTGILDWYTMLVGLAAVVALANHGALWLNACVEGDVRDRANRLAARLGVALIALLIALHGASFVARPEFRDGLSARPWGVVFPVAAVGGVAAALVWRRRGKAWRAYFASCTALYAMLATATVSVYPDILPARVPTYALSIEMAAAPRSGLVDALYWWIPGIIIVGAYFTYIHTKLPKTIREDG